MRVTTLILFSFPVFCGGGVAFAQSEPATRERGAARQQEAPEEIVVRGRRLGELRADVQTARQRAYDIFNEINSNDDFDVLCRKESRGGTNVPVQVCRARFEDNISAAAAREYMAELRWLCPPNAEGFLDTQACMFSGPGASARSAAQGVEAQAPPMRDRMNAEVLRLAQQDLRFGQAILDFYEASQEYDAARKGRED